MTKKRVFNLDKGHDRPLYSRFKKKTDKKMSLSQGKVDEKKKEEPKK
jgi:hypothetical protein